MTTMAIPLKNNLVLFECYLLQIGLTRTSTSLLIDINDYIVIMASFLVAFLVSIVLFRIYAKAMDIIYTYV